MAGRTGAWQCHTQALHTVVYFNRLHIVACLIEHRGTFMASTTNYYVHLDVAIVNLSGECVAVAIQKELL